MIPEDGPSRPARNISEGQEDVVVHVLMALAANVGGLVLEEPRETPQRIPPRCCESDDHPPPAVEDAARFALIVFAGRANPLADFDAAAGSNGRGDDNDAQVFTSRAGGAKSLLKEANQIIRVVACAVLKDERGIGRAANAKLAAIVRPPT